MTCRTILVPPREFRFCPQPAPVPANRLQEVVRIEVTDELTGRIPNVPVHLSTAWHGLTAQVTDDGIGGFIGHPKKVFPTLDANAVEIAYEVRAEGYLPMAGVVTIPAQATFPNSFTPVLVEGVTLRREAVPLAGRVVDVGLSGTTAVDGAAVRLRHIWRQAPPPGAGGAGDAPNLVALYPGAYAARHGNNIKVRRRTITGFDPSVDKRLGTTAGAGDRSIRVSDRDGIATGHLLVIDRDDPERAEYVTVESLDPPVFFPASSATLTLHHPLARIHREGARVERVLLDGSGTVRVVKHDLTRGDRCLFTSSLTGLPDGALVLITGDGEDEYQRIRRFDTGSDRNGYFRLPPISRVALFELEAENPGTGGKTSVIRAPAWGLPEQRIDLAISL